MGRSRDGDQPDHDAGEHQQRRDPSSHDAMSFQADRHFRLLINEAPASLTSAGSICCETACRSIDMAVKLPPTFLASFDLTSIATWRDRPLSLASRSVLLSQSQAS